MNQKANWVGWVALATVGLWLGLASSATALVPSDEMVCDQSGGVWNNCGSGCGPFSCTNLPPAPDELISCPEVCVPQCDCPEGQVFQGFDGCADIAACEDSAPVLCAETGGVWTDCGSGCGPYTCDYLPPAEGVTEICDAVCVPLCGCPEGYVWDDAIGCMPIDDCDPGEEGGAPPLCESSGGIWNDCGSGCGPFTCDNLPPAPGDPIECPAVCVPQCECGAGSVWDDAEGCVAIDTCESGEGGGETTLCADTGGAWTDCGSGCGPFTCDNPPPAPGEPLVCPEVCIPQCDCGEGMVWDSAVGCVAIDTCESGEEGGETTLCADTGGAWTECGSGCGPFTCDNPPPAPGEPLTCPTVCIPQCDCGEGMVWDSAAGCVAIDTCDTGEEGGETTLCADTGGAWTECGSGCGPFTCDNPPPAPGEQLTCPAICIPQCDCGEGMVWDSAAGCVAIDSCPAGEDDDSGSGGCSAGSPGATAWLASLAIVALGLRRRRQLGRRFTE